MLGLAITACDRKPKGPLERGAGIYARTCAGCHGPDGRGSTRPGFETPPKDLRAPELHERLGEEGIRRTIRLGKGQMPAFEPLLSERDLENLVLFVTSLERLELEKR